MPPFKIEAAFYQYIQAKKLTWPFILYMGSILFVSVALTVYVLHIMLSKGMMTSFWLIYFGLLLFLPVSQTAVSFMNWFFSISVPPQKLPRMDFSEGIPAFAHTLVVVPCMLSDEQSVVSLLEDLEVRYLANVDAYVDFALLTDFCDASAQTMPEDEAVLTLIVEGINQLNYKYRRQKDRIFYLFHRPRRWNEKEKIWMGYERKRGKLFELNSLLRGKGKDRFSLILGDPVNLQDVKYVITLDVDTRMPRNAARELVGVIEHPLNYPVYDEKKQRIISGYGILQPRVEFSYPGENPSYFATFFGGDSGIDPYTKLVSDVYQDLFLEGSFIGKGLYHVDAFMKAMEGRFPQNFILSHDLLEGCYARSGLVTDIQFYERYPSVYLKDVNRRHRWIRGDWQILSWVFGRVKGEGNKRVKNPISLLSRCKIADNLRRSLVPLSTVLLLLSGWVVFESFWVWSVFVIALVGFPLVPIFLVEALMKPKDMLFTAHLKLLSVSFKKNAVRLFLSFVFMLHEAFYCVDAILRTLWRMFLSRRRLLEWRTSSEIDAHLSDKLLSYVKRMLPEIVGAFLFLIYFWVVLRRIDGFVLVVLGLWMISPIIAYRISLPTSLRKIMLSNSQLSFLRGFARRTWEFFEKYVTDKDHWLPPDNFQEEPVTAIAHRTSPTNIGLSLLANLSAYDFGYISMGKTFNRTEKTFDSLNLMKKFRGHFYNWYNTQTLEPLMPLYVSSVDSGNLAGHLLVLRSGLSELTGHKIVSPKIIDGLLDTLQILSQSVTEFDKKHKSPISVSLKGIFDRIEHFQSKLSDSPMYLSESCALLRQLLTDISRIIFIANQQYLETVKKWAVAFERQCYDFLEDMYFIAPWIQLSPEVPGMWETGDEKKGERLVFLREALRSLDEIPALGEVARLEQELIPLINDIIKDMVLEDAEANKAKEWLVKLGEAIKDAGSRSSERISAIDAIIVRCNEVSDIEYEFLYDKAAHLLSIGYNVSEHKVDRGCYDLLASEARLCSFVAIAQGRMVQDHWFKLGRMISKSYGGPVLVSWGGSMFEYLMPLIVMPTYSGSLLDLSYKNVINGQIIYASKNNIPWGISESGYNKVDSNMAYQYQSFGVPGMGFKQGLSEDLVVAPYASMLALMV
ncbi:MAG: glucoamylase family protein, partial [Candidatus Omnitrophota bacterium]